MINNSTKLPKIAIVGGGPGGLLLARMLQQTNIPATTYELEASMDTRSQGGCLDLHEHTGQKALKAAGLWPEIEKVLRYEGEDMKLLDKSGKVFLEEITEGKGSRPEIDRLQLRDILSKSIKPELIQWGHKLKKVEQGENGKFDLHFDGDKAVKTGYDLVIGADGAWSKVRNLLTDVKPYYSGAYMIDTRFTDVDNRQPEVAKLVGRGSMMAIGSNQSQIAQRNGDGSIRNYIAFKAPENYLQEHGITDFSNVKEVRAKLLELFADWDSSLKQLIELCDDNFIPRPLYTLPPDHRWVNKPGLTLLGDAAHLIPPNGEGVNLAMLDALELSEAILKNIENFNDGIAEYEKKMCERSNEQAQENPNTLMDLCLAEDGPKKLADWFLSHAMPPEVEAGAEGK